MVSPARNRTILELKRSLASHICRVGLTRNRTILELKLKSTMPVSFLQFPRNRTILELKPIITVHAIPSGLTRNRTILELKLDGVTWLDVQIDQLAIAPFWN